MKKIIVLGLLLFILCGCTAEVNLVVDNDYIKEDISINYFEDSKVSKQQILGSFRQYIPAYYGVVVADTEPDEKVDGILYYDRSIKDIGDGYNFNYKYNFKVTNYNNSRSLKRAFKSSSVVKNNGNKEIIISTDKEGLQLFNQYSNLTSVVVNIKTDNEIIESNGNCYNGVCSWKFDKNNYKNNIYIRMKYKEKEKEVVVEEKKLEEKKEELNFFEKIINKNPFLSVLVIVGLFIVFLLVVSKISNKKYE